MKVRAMAVAVVALLASLFALAEPLQGTIGIISGPGEPSRPQWQSSWLDLASVTSFRSGETLRLTVSGSAQNLVVRLLPEGASPDAPVGIEGGRLQKPQNGILDVKLTRDHARVRQVSIHAGQRAFASYDLGGMNGVVTLESVERLSSAQ